MAKYDQGGGCPCGLYRVCCCDNPEQRVALLGRPTMRIKITEVMIDAAVASVIQSAVDDGAGPFDQSHSEMPRFREVMRDALQAAAGVLTNV